MYAFTLMQVPVADPLLLRASACRRVTQELTAALPNSLTVQKGVPGKQWVLDWLLLGSDLQLEPVVAVCLSVIKGSTQICSSCLKPFGEGPSSPISQGRCCCMCSECRYYGCSRGCGRGQKQRKACVKQLMAAGRRQLEGLRPAVLVQLLEIAVSS